MHSRRKLTTNLALGSLEIEEKKKYSFITYNSISKLTEDHKPCH